MKVSARTKGSPATTAKDKDGKTVNVAAVPARGPVEVEIAIPEGTDALVKAYGTEVVGSAAKGAIIISAQAFMRRLLDKGSKQEEIQAEMTKWRPDVRTIVRQSAFEKAASSLDKLSPSERADLLKRLQALPK